MGWLRRAATLSCALVVFVCLAHRRASAEAVLLDFQTDWCGYCRVMEPVVRELAAEGYQVRTINGDHEPDLVQKFRVEGYPTFVALRDGREVGRVSGQVTKAQLYALLKSAGGRGRSSTATAGEWVGARIRGQSPDSPARPRLLAGLGHLRQNNVHASTAKVPDQNAGDWESAALLSAGSAPSAAAITDRLIAASVRLRIEDHHGQSVGSGTVIDSRDGEALILTCGHVFREFKEGGRILVDFFGPQAPQQIPGKLLSYDLNSDVGLVRVEGGHRFIAASVAPPGHVCRPGDEVVSVGCDNGRDATPLVTKIVSVDRYNHAPNLQVAFEPVQGRSGGGLFNREGQLIGVCNAADAADRQGLFAAPRAIYAELDRTKLSFVYRPEAMEPLTATPVTAAPVTAAPVDLQLVTDRSPAAEPQFAAYDRLSPEEQALIDELRGSRGAEVICLVRALDAPQTKSRVFEINRASAAFWRELAHVRSHEPERKLTSLENPAPFAPWSAQRTIVAVPPAAATDRSALDESRVWPPRVRQ
jgi:thiol-disulfide isomerase/thioredoxin